MLPRLACVCCTYARPALLAQALQSYLMQDYPAERCELIILDDAGQYAGQSHTDPKTWHLVSVGRRFRTLGEKRNACAALAAAETDAYVVWDDDDIYLPWTLQAHAAALARSPWSAPGQVLVERAKSFRLDLHATGGLFHPAWAYARALFESVHGYPFEQSGQDQGLAHRFQQSRIVPADPLALGFAPYFVYRWQTSGSWHLSALPKRDGYERLRELQHHSAPLAQLQPSWPRDYRRARVGQCTPVCSNPELSVMPRPAVAVAGPPSSSDPLDRDQWPRLYKERP